MKANAPYVKKYENGILVNPITKKEPYLNAPNIQIIKMLKQWSTWTRWQPIQSQFFKGKTPSHY
jgi:hypothetical protein